MNGMVEIQIEHVTSLHVVTASQVVTREIQVLQRLSPLSPVSPLKKLAIHARDRSLKSAFVTGDTGDSGDARGGGNKLQQVARGNRRHTSLRNETIFKTEKLIRKDSIKMAKSTGVPPLFQAEEPDWTCIFADELEVAFARNHWRVYLGAMRDMGTVSDENLPSLTRLITVQVLWDRSMKQIAEHGAVIPPKRKNSRAISRINPHFAALKGLSSEILALEGDLGLSPRSRNKVSPSRRKVNHKEIGGGYLKVVK